MEGEAGKEEICVDQVSVSWRREALKSLFSPATGGEGRGNKRSRNVRWDKLGSKRRREVEEEETKSPRMHR